MPSTCCTGRRRRLRPARPVEDVLPAEPLGDFRIIRRIGGGGMGIVYEAVQRSLGRRVALKVLPFAASLDANCLQRFQNEAQAAAQLHHPNIVPVHFVGCERGVHYYAMQLIEGQDFASLIRQLGAQMPAGAAEAPAEGTATTITNLAAELSTQRASHSGSFYRTAAGLIVQAAAGLEHAHQLGIIHRDVKPANLMVDGRGNVCITDFGLAQFHSGAGLTRTGDVLGTLRYMSPEQAAGQGLPLDPRADVYALGATLYELLTLQPMFAGDNHQRLLRQILNDEPRPPRLLDRTIPAELETIVLKAVSKSPAERYRSAREFADDLRRFLDNKPILARRAGPVQRTQKWARRHPSLVAAGLLLLLVLTVGSLVSAASIEAERQKTKAAYLRERQRAAEAEARFRLARRSVDEMIQVSAELRDTPQQGLRKRLLESALAYYQEFIDQRQDDPAAQEELRDTKAHVEAILADLAVLEAGARHFLLGERSVQDDLQLSERQRQQVTALRERGLASARSSMEATADERHKRFLALVRTTDAELDRILTPDQLLRLRQIALQVRGPASFREPSVVAQLQLTPEQSERVRLLEADLFFPGPPGMPPPGPLPDLRKLHAQRWKQSSERILKLLTAEQVQRWRQLTGAPFQGELSGPVPFGFPPPAPPGGICPPDGDRS